MSEKMKNLAIVWSAALFFFGFFIWCVAKPADAVSNSERRPLSTMPALNMPAIMSGNFMEDFEDYATDQFPMRDRFRTLKAMTVSYLFRQKDMGGLYMADGYVSKLEYPMDQGSLDNASEKFRHIYEKYLEGRNGNIYFSIIPDKNYFMAEENGYPSMDYQEFAAYLKEKNDYMEYIDIFDCLELADYYKTDTHWRQEKIIDVAQRLGEGMGISLPGEYTQRASPNLCPSGQKSRYTTKSLDMPFYGVYWGQSALPLPGETMDYLDSPLFGSCQVYDHEKNAFIPIYDMEKAAGEDPYEMFLSGSKSLLSIKNPSAASDKRLVIFRDSFGSSIAPLMVCGYGEIILVDIRYLSSDLLGRFVDFQNCDVLFLYSTLVLNNSVTLK